MELARYVRFQKHTAPYPWGGAAFVYRIYSVMRRYCTVLGSGPLHNADCFHYKPSKPPVIR